MTDELWRLTAREAVAALKAREVSPSEMVAAALARIEATDGDVNAMPTLSAERALTAARRLEAEGVAEDLAEHQLRPRAHELAVHVLVEGR